MSRQILLVEDDPRDVELTLAALEACNLPHSIIVARDGEEALDYLLSGVQSSNSPVDTLDLVLLDLKLPTLDGVELLKIIRFTPKLAATPVIVMTSSNMREDMNRIRRMGVDDYLIKPFDQKAFTESLCRVIGLVTGAATFPPRGK